MIQGDAIRLENPGTAALERIGDLPPRMCRRLRGNRYDRELSRYLVKDARRDIASASVVRDLRAVERPQRDAERVGI
jgi:hypothetical protein